MSQIAYNHNLQMASFGECITCGHPIYGSNYLHSRALETGQTFYCINGHGQVFSKTTVMRLQEQLEAEKRGAELVRRQRDAERQRAEVAEKKLKRVGNGVCPDCKRSFVNLARHMKAKNACKKIPPRVGT